MSGDDKTYVSGRTWVPAALAWGALVVGFWVGRDTTKTVEDMKRDMRASEIAAQADRSLLREDVLKIRLDVSALVRATNDAVARKTFELWAARMALANPEMTWIDLPPQ